MSCKSLLTAGLLCIVASPAFAAPAVTAVPGGTVSSSHLNAAGQWVWNVQIAPTDPVPTGSSPLAAEIGITESSSRTLISATNNNVAQWDTNNPGKQIFTWETLQDVDPGAGVNNQPVGLQTRCPVGCTSTGAEDQVFAAVGSIDFNTTGAKNFLQLTVQRPAVPNAATLSTTVLTLSGAYTGKGRISELTGATTAANYDTFSGTVTRSAKGGDVDLNGSISGGDYSVLELNFNQNAGTRQWNHGDFTGDGSVTGGDYSILELNFGSTPYTVQTSTSFAGAGGGSGLEVVGAVPEPASFALLALAGLSVAGLRLRRR